MENEYTGKTYASKEMSPNPFWDAWDISPKCSRLRKPIVADIAIIGGGITGITTAMLLQDKGFKVVVLEAKSVGKGTTGRSTGNLYTLTEDLFDILISKYDPDTLNEIHASRRAGMDLIRETIQRLELDCDYAAESMYVFEDGTSNTLVKEKERAGEAGFPIEDIHIPDLPFPVAEGFQVHDQAQFNPLLYIQQLATKVQHANCRIFENARVIDIKENETSFMITTEMSTVSATYVVEATHTPKGKRLGYHTALGPYREYGVAAKIPASGLPKGIFWMYTREEKFSIRSYSRGGEHFLIAIGKCHKVGQGTDIREKIGGLATFLKKYFGVETIQYQWGGQNYKPAAYLPYIGRTEDGSNHFVATGFSADGLVYGTLAAMIISDAIQGFENQFSSLYKANRVRPVKSAKRFLKENVNVAAYFVKDFFPDKKELEWIQPGEAKVIKLEDKKVAVYREEEGAYHIVSAICPHMGCTLHWNNFEHSWDCPCHGSRFTKGGELIEGPAFDDLERIAMEDPA